MRQTSRTVVLALTAALALSGGLLSASIARADDAPDPTADPTTEPTTSPSPTSSATPDAIPTAADTAPSAVTAPTMTTPLPAGDLFTKAIKITGYVPTVSFDTRTATIQKGEPRKLTSGWYLQRTAWARWTAPLSGKVGFRVVANGDQAVDTAINVYTGSKLSKLKLRASNDDQFFQLEGYGDVPLAGYIVSMPVTKGATYWIQVGTPVSGSQASVAATGYADLALSVVPDRYAIPNDDMLDATALRLSASGVAGVIGAPVIGAGIEAWEPSLIGPSVGWTGSVWWKLTAPADGTLSVGTCDPYRNEQHAISVFALTGISSPSLARISSSSFMAQTCGWGLILPIQKGKTYYVAANVSRRMTLLDLTATASFSTPWIGAITPASGRVAGGSTVTIQGQALTAMMGSPVVKFGSKVAATTTSGPTSIAVTVPRASKKGKVAVTVTVDGVTSNLGYYTYK